MDGLCGERVCGGRGGNQLRALSVALYQNTVGSINCMLCAVEMYQGAAEQIECKVCDVVNVSHLYECLAVSENQVTDDFALAGTAACCVCGAGT